jgi:hypothetical protein
MTHKMQIAHFDTLIPHPPWFKEFNEVIPGPMPSSPAGPDSQKLSTGMRHFVLGGTHLLCGILRIRTLVQMLRGSQRQK